MIGLVRVRGDDQFEIKQVLEKPDIVYALVRLAVRPDIVPQVRGNDL
jgi:hypothetical protein